jgi:hypothetical protein
LSQQPAIRLAGVDLPLRRISSSAAVKPSVLLRFLPFGWKPSGVEWSRRITRYSSINGLPTTRS